MKVSESLFLKRTCDVSEMCENDVQGMENLNNIHNTKSEHVWYHFLGSLFMHKNCSSCLLWWKKSEKAAALNTRMKGELQFANIILSFFLSLNDWVTDLEQCWWNKGTFELIYVCLHTEPPSNKLHMFVDFSSQKILSHLLYGWHTFT